MQAPPLPRKYANDPRFLALEYAVNEGIGPMKSFCLLCNINVSDVVHITGGIHPDHKLVPCLKYQSKAMAQWLAFYASRPSPLFDMFAEFIHYELGLNIDDYNTSKFIPALFNYGYDFSRYFALRGSLLKSFNPIDPDPQKVYERVRCLVGFNFDFNSDPEFSNFYNLLRCRKEWRALSLIALNSSTPATEEELKYIMRSAKELEESGEYRESA